MFEYSSNTCNLRNDKFLDKCMIIGWVFLFSGLGYINHASTVLQLKCYNSSSGSTLYLKSRYTFISCAISTERCFSQSTRRTLSQVHFTVRCSRKSLLAGISIVRMSNHRCPLSIHPVHVNVTARRFVNIAPDFLRANGDGKVSSLDCRSVVMMDPCGVTDHAIRVDSRLVGTRLCPRGQAWMAPQLTLLLLRRFFIPCANCFLELANPTTANLLIIWLCYRI